MTLKEFIKEIKKINTRVSKTPRGRHYYFRIPKTLIIQNRQDIFKTKKEGYAVDIRGKGGYVVIPPSKGYTWENENKIKDLPDWLIKHLLTPVSKENYIEKFKGSNKGEGKRYTNALEVIGSYIRRGLQGELLWTTVTGWNLKNDPPLSEEYLSKKIAEILAKEAHKANAGMFDLKKDMEDYTDIIKRQSSFIEPEFCTCFDELDTKIWGYIRGELNLIVAVPNAGKSLTIDISALKNAERGKKVLLFSTETRAKYVIDRLLIHKYGWDSFKFRTCKFDKIEKALLEGHLRELQKLPLKIYQESVGIKEIEQITKQEQPDIVYVDYFQECIFENDGHFFAREFVRRLKSLARQQDIPVVFATQVNEKKIWAQDPGTKEYGWRKGDITPGDVRTTQALWHVPDLIILLNEKPSIFNEKSLIKVEVGKNRNGPKPTLYYAFIKDSLRYEKIKLDDYIAMKK